jgi:hypothetical protein
MDQLHQRLPEEVVRFGQWTGEKNFLNVYFDVNFIQMQTTTMRIKLQRTALPCINS